MVLVSDRWDCFCNCFFFLIKKLVNYPLWKASAINQSGFIAPAHGMKGRFDNFLRAIAPPYRGVPAVIGGMTWARAMIFYGSDHYRKELESFGAPTAVSMALPPLMFSSLVQVCNMPIVRASITMQNPANYNDPNYRTTLSTLRHLAETKGFWKLWHGLSAGLMKSVPKYITSVVVKAVMEKNLPPAKSDKEFLARSSIKSIVAGVAGAVLTNPADVLRNQMFKSDTGFFATIQSLSNTEREAGRSSLAWTWRGLGSNLIAVSLPITVTIFLTDYFVQIKENSEKERGNRMNSAVRKRRETSERQTLRGQDQESALSMLKVNARTTAH